jgi:hypothetical protein
VSTRPEDGHLINTQKHFNLPLPSPAKVGLVEHGETIS